jgi:hypothetical protein
LFVVAELANRAQAAQKAALPQTSRADHGPALLVLSVSQISFKPSYWQ